MKRGLLNVVTLMALVLTQVMVDTAQAGGNHKRHGSGYSGGLYKGYGDQGRSINGSGYGYGYRHDNNDKYSYLLGGLIIGGAATYLLTQPRYVERQTIVYTPPPPIVASGYNADYRNSRPYGGRCCCCNHNAEARYTIRPINEQYLAKCTSNVRAGPSTRYHVIDQVRTRELVTVLGEVQGRSWYKVRVGVRIGYIYAPLLEPAYYVENRYGEPDAWNSRTHTSPDGVPCREYTTTVIVDGKQEDAYGTACRQPDGSWKISSAEPL